MNTIMVRKVELGNGIPKICVPIVAKTDEEILAQAKKIKDNHPDIIEFRADWYEGVFQRDRLASLLKRLRTVLDDVGLLFTFRTKNEGGELEIDVQDYKQLCVFVCESGCVDLIDVEAYFQDGLLSEIVFVAHNNNVYVIGSNHDFHKTPEEDELKKRLFEIDEMGADIPKLAVMPEKKRDVLNLLSATLSYYESGGDKPVITMSMRMLGGISRLAGGMFGSVLTFATVEKASAPGQLPIDKLRDMIEIFYK